MKSEGLKAGVPDLIVFAPPPRMVGARGLAIEMKSSVGKLNLDQVRWADALRALDWVVIACHSASEAITAMTEMGY